MKKALPTGATALLLLSGVPAPAIAQEGCSLGSPNIVRDVTDCAAWLLEGCSPLSSPNIVRDLLDCVPG